MKRTFLHTMRSTAGLLYVGGLCLCAGLLSIWLNLMKRSPDYGQLFAILCAYLMLALPLLTMRAFAKGWAAPGDGDQAVGRCLGYLAWHAVGCAMLSAYIASTAPSVSAFVCLFGFFITGAALTGVCLFIASMVKRAPVALTLSLVLLIALREAPELGSAAAQRASGVWFARALIRLSPYTLLNPFINALFDIKAVAYAAAVCMLAVALARYSAAGLGAMKRLVALLVFAVFCAAIAVQPANLTLLDLTPERVTIASEGMANALKGLDVPVTVNLVAAVGTEDAWTCAYLQKLSERHGLITYRPVDPVEDAQVAALELDDNSLVIEQGDTFVIARADTLYQAAGTSQEMRHTFELEGVLLTAISDATGVDMTYAGMPPGRSLTVFPIEITDAQAQVLAIAFVLGPTVLLIAALIMGWRKRKHAAQRAGLGIVIANAQTRPKTKATLSMIFVNILWGLSFIASKHALGSGFGPFSLALTRFAVAAVLLLPILARREGLTFPGRDFGRLLLSSLLGMTLYFLFEYKGLERTSASTASLIVAAVPAFTLIYGVVFKHKRYRPVCYIGVLASLLGVYLIVSVGANGGDTLLGNLLILGAALCWVNYIEVTDGLMKAHSTLSITTWQSVLGALTLIPCALTEQMDWSRVTPSGWAMALYLAILCSVVAYLLYVGAIRVLEPFKTALFININPLAAVLGGVLLLNEAVSPVQLVGGAIVLVSIFIVNRMST